MDTCPNMKILWNLLIFPLFYCPYAIFTSVSADVEKTLISWVIIEDRNIHAGSILTIQEGNEFDGIVFAEKMDDKWMAGSDNWKRSENNQEKYPNWDAEVGSLVQVAIVYQKDLISIYRDGTLYASYAANNIDLLSTQNDFAVFGKRHMGGGGGISGMIEDARIYTKALTQSEIKGLIPNEVSEIEPYAWWNFEDDASEQTGRFPHHELRIGAKVENGKLMLHRGAVLIAAKSMAIARRGSQVPLLDEPYVPETPKMPNDPPDNWPIFHLFHPDVDLGAPYDPNSAIHYKGRYHLHYIYRNRAGISYAHVSSTDMVRWKWHPTVLVPQVNRHGMFSGTAFITKDGTPAHAYCGWGSNRNWIQHALDDDLDKWSEPEVMIPIDKTGKLMVNEPYFDPDVWIMDGLYYGLNGRSSHQSPLIMKSENLKDWEHIGELLHPDFDEEKLGVKKEEDISCPNFFKLGDKWVLTCISHRLGCRYFIGDFKDEQYLPEYHAVIGGNSRRYFAPESLHTPDGRRVNWSWFINGNGKDHRGTQSLPTEMSLDSNGQMRFRPIKELETLRYEKKEESMIQVKKNSSLLINGMKGDHCEIELVIKHTGVSSFGIDVLCNEEGQDGLRIKVNREKNLLEVGDQNGDFTLKSDEPLSLRIFLDACLIEVFANERQVVMADKKRPAGSKIKDQISLFSGESDLLVDYLSFWKMKSAYK